MRVRSGLRLLSVLPFVLVPLVACAPQDDDSGSATDDTTTSDTPTVASSETTSATETVEPVMTAECTSALKNAGQLTVGTDSPAYDPWYRDNDPSNGKGYESAVAYAVAEQLGFSQDQVTWVKVPFNSSYKPGEKDFDFD